MASAHSTGRRLIEMTAAGGAQSAGRGSSMIEPGAWADLLALDTGHPDLAGLSGETAIDSFVFAGDSAMVADVWSAGRHLVTGGQHRDHKAITARYRTAVAGLRDGA